MSRQPTITELRGLLRHRRHFLSDGRSATWLSGAVRSGRLIRVARGFYAEAEHWQALRSDHQHLLRMLAVDASARSTPIFSHSSAAIALGLPLVGFDHRSVHTLSRSPSGSHSGGRIVRHRASGPEAETGRTEGIAHTDLIATIVDVARTESFACGVVCAEAGLRRLVQASGETVESIRASDGSYEEVRAVLFERLAAIPRGPGTARAARVLSFASPLSESPLESLGNLQLNRLGFRTSQQIRVERPGGNCYWLDVELEDRSTFVELDGRAKYLDEEMLAGRSLDEVLLAEKAREEYVRGRTGNRVIHAGWDDSLTVRAMARFLRGFDIEPPHSPDAPPIRGLY